MMYQLRVNSDKEFGYDTLVVGNDHHFQLGDSSYFRVSRSLAKTRRQALFDLMAGLFGAACDDEKTGGALEDCLKSTKLDLHHYAFNKAKVKGVPDTRKPMLIDQVPNVALVCHHAHMKYAESHDLRDRLFQLSCERFTPYVVAGYLDWVADQLETPDRWWVPLLTP